ncbi:Microcystin LR degradation protein MlrC [Clohesyomyces aquaticus]|uniref:Microcystin LR degradation protein MlrC n=1 Tax=Clohesyomyces aquaticus TaxID=1231657 RepID=A0A1Y1YHB3_9PLEO|nr:Microcystin LR degradation protein MlrC [Clohesyomyces aquaticus]
MSPPIIATAGLACETSTFSPSKTLAPAFHPRRGNEVIDKYPFIHNGTPLGDAADWRGALIGHALPGGIVSREAYETLSSEIETRLADIVKAHSIEGLWFDIHGAMCVEELDDPEADLLRRIRKVIGPDVVVSASMDLHGNVSRELAHQCDLITCYRTAPHVDVAETRERACRNLVALIARRRKESSKALPFKAWIPVPILLPGEQTSTRMKPAKHIYGAIALVESTPGVIDAAIWVGYAWADEPRNRAAIVVVGWDKSAVGKGAEHLAGLFWSARDDFQFVAPSSTFAECLDTAIACSPSDRPFFISDSGDNPTAGGSGDVSWGLARLLERPDFKYAKGPKVIYASIPGPEAVHAAVKAGIGATVTVTAGAMVDNLHAGPVTLTGRVHSIKYDDMHARIEVVIQVGSVFAILTELRKPYHKEHDFTDLDLKPREADIVVVKIGYLEPELFAMAKGWMLGLSPGGVGQDLGRLGHKRIRRPMWPFDKHSFQSEPNLSARFIARSDEVLEGPDD